MRRRIFWERTCIFGVGVVSGDHKAVGHGSSPLPAQGGANTVHSIAEEGSVGPLLGEAPHLLVVQKGVEGHTAAVRRGKPFRRPNLPCQGERRTRRAGGICAHQYGALRRYALRTLAGPSPRFSTAWNRLGLSAIKVKRSFMLHLLQNININ